MRQMKRGKKMSNCITMTENLYLPIEDFNVDAMIADSLKFNQTEYKFGESSNLRHFVFWWFIGPKSIRIIDDSVLEIDLQCHRSSLTYRDMKQCLMVVKKYYIGDVKMPLISVAFRDFDWDGGKTLFTDEIEVPDFED